MVFPSSPQQKTAPSNPSTLLSIMDSEQLRKSIVDFVRGSLAGSTTDLVGAPVDIMNVLVKAAAPKIASDKPYGGSAHLRELLGQPVGPSSVAELAGGLVTPGGAAKAALMAIKLTPAEMRFFTELTQDIYGKTTRTLDDVPRDYGMPSTVHFEDDKLRLSSKQFEELKDWIVDTVQLKDVGDSKLPPSFYRGDFPRNRKTTNK